MRARLVAAAQDGLVFAVKWAIIIVVIAVTFMFLSGDYLVTRQRSLNGQAAFDFIVSQQQKAAAPVAK